MVVVEGGKGRSNQQNGNGIQTTATTSPTGNAVSADSRTYGQGYGGGSSSSVEPYGQLGGGGLNNTARANGSGKNGENLKKIGISSREDLEKIFNKKVNLFLFIKIKNNWMNNIKELNHLGQN